MFRQAFGDWKGVATNTQAGARIGQISFADAGSCDLRGEISVADSYDAKLVLYGDPDGTPLPKDFLVKPENRLIAKNEDGSTAVDEPLVRRVHRHSRRQGQHRPAAFDRRAVSRSEERRDDGEARRHQSLRLHAELRRSAQGPRLG